MARDRLLIDGCEINNWDAETIEELRRGRVDAVQATCAVWEDARGALGRLLDWQDRFERHADVLVPARSVAEIEAAHLGGYRAPLDAGRHQQVVDQAVQLARLINQHAQRGLPAVRRQAAVVQHGQVSDDDRQRRAQLVGSHAQEGALAPAGLLGLGE